MHDVPGVVSRQVEEVCSEKEGERAWSDGVSIFLVIGRSFPASFGLSGSDRAWTRMTKILKWATLLSIFCIT